MSILVGATSACAGAAGSQAAAADLGDTIDQSLRFTHGSNLSRNLQTAFGSFSSTATLSFWIKFDNRLTDNTSYAIWRGDNIGATGGDRALTITREGGIKVSATGNTSPTESTAKLRDPSAWYHFMIIADSSSVKFYANGSNIFTNSSGWSAGTNSFSDLMKFQTLDEVNNTIEYYLAEVNFLDGTKATVGTDFGRTNADGVWVPVEPDFTAAQYGTNGFRMQFNDSSNLGDDSAPIGASGHTAARDFTASGFDTSALSASNEDNDIDYKDTPTSNYGALIDITPNSIAAIEANLSTPSSSACTTADHYPVMEVSQNFLVEMFDQTPTAGIGNPGVLKLVTPDGTQEHTVIPSLYTPNQIGYAIDITNRATYAYDITNGAWLNGSTGTTNANVNSGSTQAQVTWTTGQLPTEDRYLIKVTGNQGGVNTSANRYNFGQRAYLMDEPSGFVAVQTNNLPEPTIKNGSDHFRALTGTGANILAIANGTNTSGTNWNDDVDTGFTNGLYLIKDRENTNQYQFVNSIRGNTVAKLCPQNGAETTYSAPSGNSVAWCWQSGEASTNGFNMFEYTGNSSSTQAVAHGLPSTPEFIITYSQSQNSGMPVYHPGLSSGNAINLDSNAAQSSSTRYSSVDGTNITFGGDYNTDGEDYMCYCWSPIEGYSKFSSYTGVGNADGAFVHTGFRPAFVLIKLATASGGSWSLHDSTRNTDNPANTDISLNSAGAEGLNSFTQIDILSNGFKIKGESGTTGQSGETLIYIAFAESPYGGENAPPATAR